MIDDPVKHVRDYVEAGSDIITVHAEVCDESSLVRFMIYYAQMKSSVGLAINPDTETSTMG